ncbi:MAG TPA: hypothetical protein VM101_08210 [Flavitalea sp.]|nr:hypothetical protein [Flavitalea sp.]
MRFSDEYLANEAKTKIRILNNTLPPGKKVIGITTLIKIEVEARRILYYAIERSLLPETKKLIIDLIEKTAKGLQLTPRPLFS